MERTKILDSLFKRKFFTYLIINEVMPGAENMAQGFLGRPGKSVCVGPITRVLL